MSDPIFDYDLALEACARHDERAFQALYRQESAQMLGLAISLLGQRDAAEDCLHDAFVQICAMPGASSARWAAVGRGSTASCATVP